MRRRFFFAGGQSWRVEGKSSASCEDGVRYREAGSGEERRDEGSELRSETSEMSEGSEYMAKVVAVVVVGSKGGKRGWR